MTITATATDDEQEKLHYILRYSSVSEADLDTANAKTKELDGDRGQEVSFDLTEADGLSNYTTYYWRVEVSDNVVANAVKGDIGNTKTWCGNATYCAGGVSPIYCNICGYLGKIIGTATKSIQTLPTGKYEHYYVSCYCDRCGASWGSRRSFNLDDI